MSAEKVASELTVAILPLGDVSPWQIQLTELVLKREFGVKTKELLIKKIPRQLFNVDRGRYQAVLTLWFLYSQLPADSQRIMGITESDLEYTDTSPCLGYADFDDGMAIYSVPRLVGPQYDESDRDAVSYHLIVHEFSHTLGLKHCNQSDCAINIQLFNLRLCASCQLRANSACADKR